jgi:hypothetical protein
VPPCNLTKPYYENVTLNISDGFYNISYSFEIKALNIPAAEKPRGTKNLELQQMIDTLTSSIPSGNI